MSLRFRFPDGELAAWLALGDPTDRSVRAWLRTGATDEDPGPERVLVRLVVDGGPVVEQEIQPDPAHDHIAVAVLTLAEPRPGAGFTVEAPELGLRRGGRLAPAPDVPGAFTFAFGSCHQPFVEAGRDGELRLHGGAGIYPAARRLLAERNAAFAMLLGDQVYSDGVSGASVRRKLAEDPDLTDAHMVEIYRHLYRGFFNERGFRELCESLPTYLTWDDHDIFDGWGSQLDPSPFDRRLYRAAEAAYREYQALRNPGASLAHGPPFDYSFHYADVGFMVLDLRGCRDYGRGEILGEAQWGHLEDFLAAADEHDTRTVFLAASVPVVHFSPLLANALEKLPGGKGTDIRDRWSVTQFIHERERLLARLFAWQSARPRRRVVILSGDVHVGAAFSVRPRHGSGHVIQWTSSALATPSGIQHRVVNRIGTELVRMGEHWLRVWKRGLALRNNIGLVRVEPAAGGGHAVSLELHEYLGSSGTLRRIVRHEVAPD